MRPIYITNTVAGAMKAPSAKDIHGRQLEFAPSGSTPVDERAFHDAWVRAMLGRGCLLLDLKLSAAKAGGGLAPRQIGMEFGDRLEAAGFSAKDIMAWLGPDPEAVAARQADRRLEDAASAARLELEAASAKAVAEAQRVAAEAETARLEAERRDAEALAALEAEEAAAKAANAAEEAALLAKAEEQAAEIEAASAIEPTVVTTELAPFVSEPVAEAEPVAEPAAEIAPKTSTSSTSRKRR